MRIMLALSLLLAGVVHAADFPVLDGNRQAVIVYDRHAEKESVQAYQDLAQYLKLATGREFTVQAERDYQPGAKLPIFVGPCRPVQDALRHQLHGLDRDAYLVAVTPECVMLVGARPWSTYWAVCQFLEDVVGVRWLIPGPLGEDVPSRDRVLAPVGTKTYTPVMRSRLWSGAHYGGVWSLRQRIHERDHFHHNLLNIFTADKYWATHPEYFPLHGKERYKPGDEKDNSWQPCMGIEGTVQVAADAAREAFRKDPDLESYSFGMNDGGGWCECPACQTIDRPMKPWHGFDGSKSVLFYTWLNRIAENLSKDFPDKKIGCLAYSAAILPPPGLKLHPMIIPYYTSNRADYYEPSFRQQDEQMVNWWSQHLTQMGIYDYAYGVGFAVPRIYNHLFQQAVQYAVAHKVNGFYAEVYPNWGLDGHKLYVMSRVLWNPNVNIDRITDEWYQRMFRESAGPMKRYFERCERAWREQRTGPGHWAYRLAANPDQFKVFPPAVLQECTGYLDQAAAEAKTDLVKQRIHFFRKTWDLTALLAGNYWAGYQVQALIEQKAPVEQVAAAMRDMAAKMATVDVDAYKREKVGDDPIAYFPPLAGWFEPLKGAAITNAARWFAATIANDAVAAAKRSGKLDGPAIRELIVSRTNEIFGTAGTENYQKMVGMMRDMAGKIGTAVKAEAPPQVDGVLDEAVWQRADVLTNFIKWGSTAPAEKLTKVRLAHDGTNLYLALECYQDTSKLCVKAAPRDGNTWSDDSVEIFVNRDMNAAPLAQFIINAAGAYYDRYQRHEQEAYAETLAVNFPSSWAAKVYPDRWTAELRLPLKEMGINLAEKPLLRLNFVRNVQEPDQEISAWFSSLRAHADPLSRGWILVE